MEERLNGEGLDNEWYTTRNHYYKTGYGIQQNNGNCTAYAHGRVQEICQAEIPYSRGNAISFASKSFLQKIDSPSFGAFVVWGGTYAGHVAVVEHVYENGDILISESSWHGFIFKTTYLSAANNYTHNGMPFVGFYLYDGVTKAIENEQREIEERKEQFRADLHETMVEQGYIPSNSGLLVSFAGGADSMLLAGTIGTQVGAKFIRSYIAEYERKGGEIWRKLLSVMEEKFLSTK